MQITSLTEKVDVKICRSGSLVIPNDDGYLVVAPRTPLFSTAAFLAVGVVTEDGSIDPIDRDSGEDLGYD